MEQCQCTLNHAYLVGLPCKHIMSKNIFWVWVIVVVIVIVIVEFIVGELFYSWIVEFIAAYLL